MMTLNKLILLSGLVLQCCLFFAVSQRCSNSRKNNYGRRFFLSEMRFTGRSPPHESYPISVRVVSSTAGYVYVTAPGCNLYHQRYRITPNVSEITITPKNVTGTIDQERIGILLESTVDTAMFVLDNIPSKRYAVDGYMLLPEETLGLTYVVAAYSPNSEVQHCMIVGTQNNTSVDITFKSSMTLRLNSQTVSGKTYKNQMMRRKIDFLDVIYLNIYGDISGSIVNSDKPVAVISDVPEVVVKPNNTGGRFDELNSQLLPVNQWGTVYIVPPIYPRSKYMVRVFAFYNNTNISFYSSQMNTWSVLLNTGEFREYEMGMYPLLAKGDRQFSIFQISYSSIYVAGGEGSMTVVPALDQFSSGPYVIPTLHAAHLRYHFTNYISIVIEKQYKDNILYNGTRLQPVREQTAPPPFNNYVVLSARLTSDTVHILSNENPSAKFTVLAYGISNSLQYGYLAGMNFHNTDCMSETTTRLPPITETTAAVVSTTSTLTGRKLRCFSCSHLPHLRYCDTLQECQEGQICFVERKLTTGGHSYYSSGCTYEDSCPVKDTTTTSNHGDCFSCCKSDFCNNNGYSDTGLPALSQRGPYCFDCQNFDRPTACDRAVLCAENEVCSIEQYHWGGTESIYKMGCLAKHSCPAVGRHSSRSVPVCHSCCETDFCNDNCTRVSSGIQIIGTYCLNSNTHKREMLLNPFMTRGEPGNFGQKVDSDSDIVSVTCQFFGTKTEITGQTVKS